MEKRLARWAWGGALFTAAAGTLLHFVYGWSGGHPLAAAFCAVNESVWEHMKLLFFPVFFWSVVQLWSQGRACSNLLAVRAVSLAAGLILIPVLYYTYSGILGRQLDWFNILIFYLAVLGLFSLDRRLLRSGKSSRTWQQLAGLAALWALALVFVYCTFFPVELPLWQDPSGFSGIP